jgi:two-component system, OmpR family, sensor histidine kinase MprB
VPHIFERFWRGTAAAGRAGSGIGLAVAAELTAAHGGVPLIPLLAAHC